MKVTQGDAHKRAQDFYAAREGRGEGFSQHLLSLLSQCTKRTPDSLSRRLRGMVPPPPLVWTHMQVPKLQGLCNTPKLMPLLHACCRKSNATAAPPYEQLNDNLYPQLALIRN